MTTSPSDLTPNTTELAISESDSDSKHPGLILTQAGVRNVRAGLGTNKLFDKAVAAARAEVDAEIANGIEVPIPKDMAGGSISRTT